MDRLVDLVSLNLNFTDESLSSLEEVGLCAKNREQDFFVDMTGVEAQEIRALLRKVDPYMLAYYFVEFQRGRFIG